MNLAEPRSLFPVSRRYAYLNHASVAALPTPVVTAMDGYLQEQSLKGGQALEDWDERLEGIRQEASRLIGAHRDEIVFTTSVSHGLNLVAAGLRWQAGDNLICAETEFPANVYPWMNLQRRGIEVRFAPARANRILVEDVVSLMDGRTRLVAISFVEFGTGYRNDLAALAEACHERGAYLCVDGIQGLGALQFDVRHVGVDFLATHAAKWMLGPIGAAFCYIRRDRMPLLDPVMAGWRSVVDRDNYYRYDSPLRPGGERFEPGSLNAVGLVGMAAAIDLLLTLGLDAIESRILELTSYLIAGLQARGCTITSPIARRQERSGIVCFRHPEVPAPELGERLCAADVIVSVRGDVVRVSPHFWNSEEDIERLLAVLNGSPTGWRKPGGSTRQLTEGPSLPRVIRPPAHPPLLLRQTPN
ncbi:MAG: aminotransferase class V-fold PLP-dependent enzyme [Anaerolineae bacterium]|nr:aminotransferase class V-fold PLP-dependent enzyme [Anaerolineae bacterium]